MEVTSCSAEAIDISALVHVYEGLNELPEPVLDLSTETQTLGTLLDVGKELERLAPQLVPLVCQMLLRELGRIPQPEREKWLRRILPLAPPEDDGVLRAVLERVSARKVLTWILAIPGEGADQSVKRLQSLFHAVSYEGAIELIDSLAGMQGAAAQLVRQALPVLRAKVIAFARPQCACAGPPEAASLLVRLALVGGKQIVPLVTQLIRRIDPADCATLQRAITVLGEIGDRSLAPTIVPYLDHDDRTIRLLAARELLRLGGESALQSLADMLRARSRDIEEKKAILTEAARTGRSDAARLLKGFARPGLFGRSSKELRRHAAALLGGYDADHKKQETP